MIRISNIHLPLDYTSETVLNKAAKLINVDKIIEYNVKTNTVIFSTGESTDLVARSKRKELKERVLSYN